MTTSHAPIRAGHVTPEDDDAAGLGSNGGTKDRENGRQDSASAVDLRKRLATVRAALALKGHELVRLPSGALLVQRWGLQRELPDLDAAEAFLRQVGGRP